jgi:DNA-binding transcriptional LysR family regulator
MRLPALEAFVSVCETGSFSAAAQRLHLTQPAVSKRIAGLEDELGHPLFDRVARRVSLTEAGHAYLPHARRLLAESEDGRRALDQLHGEVAGQLRLALSHHVALHRMPPLLQQFTARFPAVDIDIEFLGSEDACRQIETGRVELAIITLPDPPIATLAQRTIWDDPLDVVVAPNHPLTNAASLTVHALFEYPALLTETQTYTYRIVARALVDDGRIPGIRLQSNYLESLKMLVTAGLGWSVLPRTMIDADLATLTLPGVAPKRSLGSVHHPGRVLSRAASALLALLNDSETV